MKLYSYIVLCASLSGALASPAFCQQSEDLAAQSRALADQAARFAAQAKDMTAEFSADRIATLQEQAARVKVQFDDSKIAEMEQKALTAWQDKLSTLPDIQSKLDSLRFKLDSDSFGDLDLAAKSSLDQFDMAFLQAPVPPVPPVAPTAPTAPMVLKGRLFTSRDGASYDAGVRALDQHKYDAAIQNFDGVINAKAPRADGALYWKAYALNRLGKRDEALAVLAGLRRDYASSAWLNDAQALEAEVKQNAGQPISPAQESNEDIKLYAINALVSSDPERAIPLIEGVLKGSTAPNVKDRALFVLSQSRLPRAQQVLTDYAKGSGNPDLQLHAIEYLGNSGTKESQQQLASIYSASSDTRVKSTIIQILARARAYDALMNIAKTEKDQSLRDTAIRDVASSKGAPIEGLLDLYSSSDVNAKRAIVDGFLGKRDAKTLVDLARKENDPTMKKTIVERLSSMRDNKEAMDYMMELLK